MKWIGTFPMGLFQEESPGESCKGGSFPGRHSQGDFSRPLRGKIISAMPKWVFSLKWNKKYSL